MKAVEILHRFKNWLQLEVSAREKKAREYENAEIWDNLEAFRNSGAWGESMKILAKLKEIMRDEK